MITQQIVWKCRCDQCKHEWTTKGYDLPKNCAKCRSLRWNHDSPPADYTPELAPVKIATPVYSQPERNDVISRLQSTIDAIESGESKAIVEPVDEWAGWSEERKAPDEAAGETVTYRQHIKTGKRKEIRRETAWD